MLYVVDGRQVGQSCGRAKSEREALGSPRGLLRDFATLRARRAVADFQKLHLSRLRARAHLEGAADVGQESLPLEVEDRALLRLERDGEVFRRIGLRLTLREDRWDKVECDTRHHNGDRP